jgi:hypothetical protein
MRDQSELLAAEPTGSSVSMVESTMEPGAHYINTRGRRHDAAECPVEDEHIREPPAVGLHPEDRTTSSLA